MKPARLHKTGMRQILAGTIASFVLLPTLASAATNVTVQTTKLLPASGATCSQMQVTSVTPYIYDKGINSFDVVIPDASYVAIGGSVGNTVIPLRYISRTMTPDRQLRIHADTDAVMIGVGVPVSMTLLSAKNGMVCAATISFAVNADGTVVPMTSVPVPVGNTQAHTQSSHGNSAMTGSPRAHAKVKVAPAVETMATTTALSPIVTSTSSFFENTCSTFSGALKIWLLLIVIYIIIAALAVLVQTPVGERSPAIPVAFLLIPLILLVGFWYFVPQCRVASWIPIVLLIIAIVGLIVAFSEKRGIRGDQLLLSNTNTKSSMPMPASQKPVSVVTPTSTAPQNGQPRPLHTMQPGGQSSQQNQSQRKN